MLLDLAAEGPQLALGGLLFSLFLCMNAHTKLLSGLVGPPFLAMKLFSQSVCHYQITGTSSRKSATEPCITLSETIKPVK